MIKGQGVEDEVQKVMGVGYPSQGFDSDEMGTLEGISTEE